MLSPLQVNISAFATDVSILSSIAITLGAVFVVFQIRQDERMIAASIRQANASAEQARLTMQQVVQNSALATTDMVMRIYEFANSREVQSSYMTVLRSRISSYEDYERLPEEKQVAFVQVASLFESLGFLVERGFVQPDIIDDMFATKLAWEMLEPFVLGAREKYAAEDYYVFFEKLYHRLSEAGGGSVAGEGQTRISARKE